MICSLKPYLTIPLIIALVLFVHVRTEPLDNESPGALQISLGVSSINNIAMTLIPLMSYYLIRDQTFEVDYEQGDWLYDLTIYDVHIDDIKFNSTQISYLPDTNILRVALHGIDVNFLANGTISALEFLTFSMSHVNITNITCIMDLSVQIMEQGKWQLQVQPYFMVEDFEVSMESSVLNFFISLFHNNILSIIQEKMLQLSDSISKIVTELNIKIAKGDSFFINLFDCHNYYLNLSPSMRPNLNSTSNLLDVYLNGSTLDVQKNTTHIPKMNKYFPARFEHSHHNQFWIHQTALQSFMFGARERYTPVELTDSNQTSALLKLLPEIKQHYGQNVTLNLTLNFIPKDENALQFNKTLGFVLGQNETFNVTIEAYASTKEISRELACSFNFNMKVSFIVDLQNFVVHLHIGDALVENTQIGEGKVKLYGRNYNNLFTDLLNAKFEALNNQFKKGFDIKELDPTIQMISNIITNTTVTPLMVDEFIYMGFSYAFDDDTLQVKEQPFIIQ